MSLLMLVVLGLLPADLSQIAFNEQYRKSMQMGKGIV